MFRWLCALLLCWNFWDRNGEYVYANDDVERFEGIIVPPAESSRQCRGLKLKNGMKVMLMHDPLVDKAAVSVTFGTGSLNDPENLPGLVNLIGYILIKAGTNHVRNFENFVESHWGKVAAPYTGGEVQSFSFEIDPSYFVPAFNKFAKFFDQTQIRNETKPVILVKSLQAVEIEHRECKLLDNFRISQVERTISKPGHPYNHLTSGTYSYDGSLPQLTQPTTVSWGKDLRHNYSGSMSELSPHAKRSRLSETLVIPDVVVQSLQAEVQAFFSSWYSSNTMTMAVLGHESLDALENMVVSSFQGMRCSDPPAEKNVFKFEDHPWGAEQLGNKVYIVPANEEIQYVALTFPLPDYDEDPDLYNARADDYVNFYITHQGRDTLSTVLQSRGFCTELLFQYDAIAGIAFARVVCEITDAGLEQLDTVINLIFQYIHMLNEGDPREWMFNEIRLSSEKAFLYGKSNDNEALEFVRAISTRLQQDKFPMEDPLVRVYLRNEWKPEVVQEFLSYLRPENMNVLIVSRAVAGLKNLSQEKHFQVPYKIAKIPKDSIQKWSTKELTTDLKFPLPNEFLSENLDVFPLEEGEPSKSPVIIHRSPTLEIWLKQDDVVRLPEVCFNFELISPATRIGPVQNTLWRVFGEMFTLLLNESLYSPSIAGIKWADWSVEVTEPGLHFRLWVLGDKLPLLVEKIIAKLVNFERELDENWFQTASEQFLQAAGEGMYEDHIFLSEWYTQYLYTDIEWDVGITVNVGKTLKLSDMKKFLRRLFRRIFVRGLINGNCNEEKALELVKILEKAFRSSGSLLLSETLRPRFMEFDDGSHHIYQVANKHNDIHAYASFFQVHMNSVNMNHVKTLLLYSIIKEPCYQLLMPADNEAGAITQVQCALFTSNSMQGFGFTVGSKRDPRYIDKNVEKFLQSILRILKNITEDDLRQYKDHVVEEYLSPATVLEYSHKYWSEVSNLSYNFERTGKELDYLYSLTKKDLEKFYKAKLEASSGERRKLVVHVLPKNTKRTKARLIELPAPGATKIGDIEVFKSHSTWLPQTFT